VNIATTGNSHRKQQSTRFDFRLLVDRLSSKNAE
jgi:hypothetical protein